MVPPYRCSLMATRDFIMAARMIQNMSEAKTLEPHWGYVDRALPCTNDRGSCEYLDTIYHSHDLGMLYTFIFWAALGGVLFAWCLARHIAPGQTSKSTQCSGESLPVKQSSLYRLSSSLSSHSRHYLLPEVSSLHPIFGHTTRLQILVLAILSGYLTIFTMIGIVYKRWITPVKNHPGLYNTRTSLGTFADRVGVLAFALTPLSILLASRESLLSLITGLPYQSFNFLHRWLGYIIYAQSVLHTMGWVVVEGKLYQPQPAVWNEFVVQKYIVWGFVAMVLLSIIFFMSLPCMVRLTGHETWRKMHYVAAMLYVGACWGHWSKLSCWMIASLTLWLLDRGVRFVRTAILHYQFVGGRKSMGFRGINARCEVFPDDVNGDVVRLEFEHNHGPWEVGQHFFLTFAEGRWWQSHPFTPSSVPRIEGLQEHVYVFRAKKGETKRVAEQIKRKSTAKPGEVVKTPVILAGPYGKGSMDAIESMSNKNVLCVAGGSGITFVLPVLMSLINERESCQCERRLGLVWAIRTKSAMAWIQTELIILHEASRKANLTIQLFVTRDIEEMSLNHQSGQGDGIGFVEIKEDKISSSRSSDPKDTRCAPKNPRCAPKPGSYSVKQATHTAASLHEVNRPDLDALVHEFLDSTTQGSTCVFASGPGGMISDLRDTVAKCNDGIKAMKGDERYHVQLISDNRLEW